MLTKEEQALAANADLLLTKNKIIQAVYELFGKLAEEYKATIASTLPADITRMHPKISRGENYLGLPWVMLDYPRYFSGADGFAIRTMFWWGHYFSLHLLLQGNKMQWLNEPQLLQANGWYFSTGTNPWQHQFDAASSIPATNVSKAVVLKQADNGFYKLSIYLPLQEWDNAEVFFKKHFAAALQLIKVS